MREDVDRFFARADRLDLLDLARQALALAIVPVEPPRERALGKQPDRRAQNGVAQVVHREFAEAVGMVLVGVGICVRAPPPGSELEEAVSVVLKDPGGAVIVQHREDGMPACPTDARIVGEQVEVVQIEGGRERLPGLEIVRVTVLRDVEAARLEQVGGGSVDAVNRLHRLGRSVAVEDEVIDVGRWCFDAVDLGRWPRRQRDFIRGYTRIVDAAGGPVAPLEDGDPDRRRRNHHCRDDADHHVERGVEPAEAMRRIGRREQAKDGDRQRSGQGVVAADPAVHAAEQAEVEKAGGDPERRDDGGCGVGATSEYDNDQPDH